MLYRSHSLCLSQYEIRKFLRAMCGMKLMDKVTKYLRQMLNIEETIDQMVKASRVYWYKDALRMDK